jgi:hypothetical protein
MVLPEYFAKLKVKAGLDANKKASIQPYGIDAQITLVYQHSPSGRGTLIYSASATTSFTSGIILFIIPSIPAFKVIIEEGQPLQLPCNIKFTLPSS